MAPARAGNSPWFLTAVVACCLPCIAVATQLRRGIKAQSDIFDVEATNGSSAFPATFIGLVDTKLDQLLSSSRSSGLLSSSNRTALAAARVAVSSVVNGSGHKEASISGLADIGAAELSLDVAIKLVQKQVPDKIMKMLRDGAGKPGQAPAAAVGNAQANLDPDAVAGAITSLNNMLSQTQTRMDAKQNECQEMKSKLSKTQEQIKADLGRLGQACSSTARVITTVLGQQQTLTLNGQMAKEELARETKTHEESRASDLAQLELRKSNLQVAEFILDLTKCPGKGAAAALVQGHRVNTSGGLSSLGFKACVNETDGAEELSFDDPHLELKAKQLTKEGQQMLMRFAMASQTSQLMGGGDMSRASLQAAVLGAVPVQAMELDDGDEDFEEEDFEAKEQREAEEGYKYGSLIRLKKQVPVVDPACEPPLERKEVAEVGKCEDLPASCCVCNQFFTAADGHANDADGACSYVPGEKSCKPGDWLKKNVETAKAQTMCLPMEAKQPVTKPTPEELKAANKCQEIKPDCGVLHDVFAGLYGEMKDLVEETQMKINKESENFERLKTGINSQLQTQATQLGSLQSTLAEATSNKASETDQQVEKQKELEQATKMSDSTIKGCKDAMREMLYTEMCGVIAVRNAVIAQNLPGEPVPVDCKIGEWVIGDCSVQCDDKLVGGTSQMKREIIVKNSPRGFPCPALVSTRTCNQQACPVDCKVSPWSTFGKCTKECGGGVQSRSRNALVKPKNGGMACDAMLETRPCNSGACDRDCELGKFLPFEACTKACNAGYQAKRKRVLAEAIGEGHCPKPDDPLRLVKRPCNTKACVGDEVCTSTIDLVIAIDSSGSVTQKGFDVLKVFAGKIVQRMAPSVRVGIVEFGNGQLDKDKVVSDAIVATNALESDMTSVAAKVGALPFRKGFTNMAQAILKAKDLLAGSRKDAETVVMLITDGRPSFKMSTTQAVENLRQSSRLMIVQVQGSRKQEIAELLKGYASVPWDSNYKHINGKKALTKSYDAYATELIADLCPSLESPFMKKEK